MAQSRRFTAYDLVLIEQAKGEWAVQQDRRTLVDWLTYDEAVSYVERIRKPDEKVVALHADGYTQDVTKAIRPSRRLTAAASR